MFSIRVRVLVGKNGSLRIEIGNLQEAFNNSENSEFPGSITKKQLDMQNGRKNSTEFSDMKPAGAS